MSIPPFSRRIAMVLLVLAQALAYSRSIAGQGQAVIPRVRSAVARRDFAAGEQLIADYQRSSDVTPETLEALSWLGRGALAARQFDKADHYASQTHELALQALKQRSMDQEPHLPIALGAAIEVRAQPPCQDSSVTMFHCTQLPSRPPERRAR